MKRLKEPKYTERNKERSNKKAQGRCRWLRFQDLDTERKSSPRWWWLRERIGFENQKIVKKSRGGV